MLEITALGSIPKHSPVTSETHAVSQPPITLPQDTAASLRTQLAMGTFSPVNQDGTFAFDRVIKCGYAQKRTHKTKTWKTIYLVMRPDTLSIYKSDKEDKLKHKIYLSELTAVTLLKDPKQKRQNVFGLFSPSKNFRFQAATTKDAQDWIDVIRRDARIEEEDEIFLASPVVRRESYAIGGPIQNPDGPNGPPTELERLASSSPEPPDRSMCASNVATPRSVRRASQIAESSGISGNELASHSDLSDIDTQRINAASIESLAAQFPFGPQPDRPGLGGRNASQTSGVNVEHDPDRVIWQGWLWLLRSKGGLRQWKKSWAVLRPRNLILYRDSSEYSAHLVVALSSILSVVDLDPISRTKKHCLQIITEEKRFRFCARDEETLLQCLGAFKSLLAKRRELESRAATTATATTPQPRPLAAGTSNAKMAAGTTSLATAERTDDAGSSLPIPESKTVSPASTMAERIVAATQVPRPVPTPLPV